MEVTATNKARRRKGMATSTCVRCGSSYFEVTENEPRGSAFKLLFVQCSSCGGVITAIEMHNLTALLGKQNQALVSIGRALNVHIDLPM
jgi:hypothetical protein